MRVPNRTPAAPVTKFKDKLILDAPSVSEYRDKLAELASAGVAHGRPMLECLGVTGNALERALADALPYEDALALAQAWGDLDVTAVWDDLPTAEEIEAWESGDN
jgi:hypothetical protein